MLLFSLGTIPHILLICIIWSVIFTRNKCDLSKTAIPIQMNIVTNNKSSIRSLTIQESNTAPFAVLLQLNTVMAIMYTEEGNRYRRLGNLPVAKRYYQKAIQLHRYVRQTLLHVQNTQ